MINFANAIFITSCTASNKNLEISLPEILFVGKSNCGKSTLINTLTNHKNLAFVSSKPGHTKLLNYFNIDKKFYLVDAPGYGYAKEAKSTLLDFGELMESYFKDNKNIKLVCFLIDSRRVPGSDDIDFYNFLKQENIPYCIVLTKSDKLNQSEKSKIEKNLSSAGILINNETIFLVSKENNNSIINLQKYIEEKL